MLWSGSPTTTRSRPSPGDRLQQPDLPGVGVLVLVDEDGGEPVAEVGPDVTGLREQHRSMDQLGVVERALEVEHGEVLLHEGTRSGPLRAVRLPTEAGQVVGRESELASPAQHRVHLAGEPSGRQRGVEALAATRRFRLTASWPAARGA